MEKDSSYYTGLIFGELNSYCYMVNRGCKSIATMGLQDRHIADAKQIIENEKLKFYSEFLYEGWTTIYIYKHDYLLEVIKNSPDEPKTVYEHWVLGKMFGYSDEEIGKFIVGK